MLCLCASLPQAFEDHILFDRTWFYGVPRVEPLSVWHYHTSSRLVLPGANVTQYTHLHRTRPSLSEYRPTT